MWIQMLRTTEDISDEGDERETVDLCRGKKMEIDYRQVSVVWAPWWCWRTLQWRLFCHRHFRWLLQRLRTQGAPSPCGVTLQLSWWDINNHVPSANIDNICTNTFCAMMFRSFEVLQFFLKLILCINPCKNNSSDFPTTVVTTNPAFARYCLLVK